LLKFKIFVKQWSKHCDRSFVNLFSKFFSNKFSFSCIKFCDISWRMLHSANARTNIQTKSSIFMLVGALLQWLSNSLVGYQKSKKLFYKIFTSEIAFWTHLLNNNSDRLNRGRPNKKSVNYFLKNNFRKYERKPFFLFVYSEELL